MENAVITLPLSINFKKKIALRAKISGPFIKNVLMRKQFKNIQKFRINATS